MTLLFGDLNVQANDHTVRSEVKQAADVMYHEIAMEWFGKPVPPSNATIKVIIVKDRKDIRGSHVPNLITIAEQRADVASNYLRHELTHLIFANRFGHNQSQWIKEGTACQYNKPSLVDVMKLFAMTGDMPRLVEVITVSKMDRSDRRMYAAATSFVEFLIAWKGKEHFLTFCENPNLSRFYGSVAELEKDWKQYVLERYK